MSNILRMFCAVITVGAVLSVFSVSYAETTTQEIEIKGSESASNPTRYSLPGDPRVQLSITMKGIRKERVKETIVVFTDESLSFSRRDLYRLPDVNVDVKARCLGAGAYAKLKPGGHILVCDMGAGLEVDVYEPVGSDIYGVFTLTRTTKVDDGAVTTSAGATSVNLTCTQRGPDSTMGGAPPRPHLEEGAALAAGSRICSVQ